MNLVIGLGNAGTHIAKLASSSELLKDVEFYAIDSVLESADMASLTRVKIIPIISDEKSGSGRNRERGAAMFEYHKSKGAFDELMATVEKCVSPVVVITSSAGGTGSGSAPALCKMIMEKGLQVVPIIVCPDMDDPDAYHLNTTDLMIDLQAAGIETYATVRNRKGGADYTPINKEVVGMIEIIFGKKYDKAPVKTDDTQDIDDSDLDVIMRTPGRFVAVSAEAMDIPSLQKEITRKVFSGFQPAWTTEDSVSATFMVAYGLTSMFAAKDFDVVFSEVKSRIDGRYDEFRNIVNIDNNGVCKASVIVAGLPNAAMKKVEGAFKMATGIAEGMSHTSRPAFMTRRKAVIEDTGVDKTDKKTGDVFKQFKWR